MKNLTLRNLLRRRVLAALVLGTAIVGGTLVYAQAAKVTTTYRTALVTYGTITQSIGMAGNLAPVSEADLNFASGGTVQSVYVQVGQAVGAGTPLATLDSTLLSAQLLQAQATLASAEAKVSQDRAGPTGSSLTSAQNSVASALVSMTNAQTSLADTQAINDVGRAAGAVEAMPISAAVMNEGGMALYIVVKLALVISSAIAVLLAALWVRNDRPGAGWVYFFTISAIRVTTVALAIVSLHNALLLQSLSGSA